MDKPLVEDAGTLIVKDRLPV
jgi:hypothetical protein